MSCNVLHPWLRPIKVVWNVNKNLFYSILYGTIFCRNSSNGNEVLLLQKKMIRIIAGTQVSCRAFFYICILPPTSEYIFALMRCITDKHNIFKSNSEVHSTQT